MSGVVIRLALRRRSWVAAAALQHNERISAKTYIDNLASPQLSHYISPLVFLENEIDVSFTAIALAVGDTLSL